MANTYAKRPVVLLKLTAMLLVCCMAATAAVASAETPSQSKKLKITIGESIKLGPKGYINTATLATSRTGVIAAFVPVYNWPGMDNWQWHTIRISKDGGRTWTQSANASVAHDGGAACIGLRGGSMIKQAGPVFRIPGEQDWFQTNFTWFPDDLSTYRVEKARAYMPNAALTLQEPSPLVWAGPVFDKGKILQPPNGDLLSPMYGKFQGDKNNRIFITRSVDRGKTWRFYANVAHDDQDPHPDVPGTFRGYAESSIALLPNGQMLCVMRAGGWGSYRSMYIAWSDDVGKTWTKPRPTKPYLYSIWPTLQVLDNGVIACVHGRPGFHISFSADNGHTWSEKVTFTDLPAPQTTGQVDMIKIGPNKVLAIGGVGGSGGTRIFPVTVELIDSPVIAVKKQAETLTTADQNAAVSELAGSLRVTLGKSMRLGDLGHVDSASLEVSPNGVISAFVPTRDWPGRQGQLFFMEGKMFQRYLVTFLSLVFMSIAIRTASAQEAQYAGYASMLERLESVEAQLASREANILTSAVGGCQSCDADCGCCCGGGWSKDFEVLFLRFHESDGVDEDKPVDQFGFDPAWRVTVGHTDSSGLSYRVRYFTYDQDATINGENYSVETYNVDFEIAQLIQVSCLLDVEISAGVRYNHYQHDESQTDGEDNVADQQFEGIGLIIGLSADRQLGCGDLYGRVRHSILVGDDEDPDNESFYSDSIHSQLEIGVGYKVEYCIGPAVAELRLGVEMQNWYTYEDQDEEVGFAGFLVGAELNF